MLFNLSQNDQQTILVWQQAQRDVLNESGGALSFQFYGQRLNEFLEHPDWEGLEGFERIEPAPARLTTPPQASPSQPAGKNLLLAVHGAKEVDEMRAVMLRPRARLRRANAPGASAERPCPACGSFFRDHAADLWRQPLPQQPGQQICRSTHRVAGDDEPLPA